MNIKKGNITMDDLAVMIKQGFDEVDERFNGVNSEIKKLKKDLKEFKGDNSREHAEMKLYLNNAAYKFEFVDLKNRVEILEKKSML